MQLYLLGEITPFSSQTKLLGKTCIDILSARFPNATALTDINGLSYPCVAIRGDYPMASRRQVESAALALSQGKTYEKGGVFALYSPAQRFRVLDYPEGFSAPSFAYYVRRGMQEITDKLQREGVTVYGAASLLIDYTVKVEQGAVLYPNNVLTGNTVIEKNAVLYPGNVVHDSTVGEGATLFYTVANAAAIQKNANVGPFAHLRAGTYVGENVRVGNFVEIKNSHLHSGVKAAHLTYVGDAEIGKSTNVGCGVVFANYNGKIKQKTVIGERCFLGCNSNFIAPLTVGADCFVAAGTTVTEHVPNGSFVIGRNPQKTVKKKER